MTTRLTCHLCGAALREIQVPGDLHFIASDCRPINGRARLGLCEVCHTTQTIPDPGWKAEAERIYHDYSMYALSDGKDQISFGGAMPLGRTAAVLDHFLARIDLPTRGRLLDFGCGTGTLLRVFARLRPDWRLNGLEQGTWCVPYLQGIPGLERLTTTDLSDIDGRFDMISMIHVVEHLVSPDDTLRALGDRLTPGGLLFAQMPYFIDNPFDLLVFDHCSHFTPHSIAYLLRRCGFRLLACTTDWIHKEISVVATYNGTTERQDDPPTDEAPIVGAHLHWLTRVIEHARDHADRGKLGVFGTSTPGSWLTCALADEVTYFVDEDTHRIGKRHMNKPVLAPNSARPGTTVYVALPPAQAARVAQKVRPQLPAGVTLGVPPSA